MDTDIEETLGRELREVASGLQVPAMPPVPQESPRTQRRWQPLLVAAAVVLIVAGAVALVAALQGGQGPQPTPPLPTPTETAADIPTTAPEVPYVLDQRLYVDGERVPGAWWMVEVGDAGWIAQRTDYTWWWGRGPDATAITELLEGSVPAISPDGRYVAYLGTENGGELTGFDTRPDGEGLGGVPVDLSGPQDGTALRVRAVTNDGLVIAQGQDVSLLWLPLTGDGSATVDLTRTAPGQLVDENTPAGLLVTDGEDETPYLAQISDAGELSRLTTPAHEGMVVSPGAAWLAWAPEESTGGEVTEIHTLEVQASDGTEISMLKAPEGWDFRVETWTWEDDDYLVAAVVRRGDDGGERMVRCGMEPARCVLIQAP
jgi:hypothetical protein